MRRRLWLLEFPRSRVQRNESAMHGIRRDTLIAPNLIAGDRHESPMRAHLAAAAAVTGVPALLSAVNESRTPRRNAHGRAGPNHRSRCAGGRRVQERTYSRMRRDQRARHAFLVACWNLISATPVCSENSRSKLLVRFPGQALPANGPRGSEMRNALHQRLAG